MNGWMNECRYAGYFVGTLLPYIHATYQYQHFLVTGTSIFHENEMLQNKSQFHLQ